jgi:hypothetical protein
MADYEKKVIDALKLIGCTFVREGKGDHSIWHSPLQIETLSSRRK